MKMRVEITWFWTWCKITTENMRHGSGPEPQYETQVPDFNSNHLKANYITSQMLEDVQPLNPSPID